MRLSDLAAPGLRAETIGGAVVLACLLSALAGARVASWRADSLYSWQVSDLKGQVSQLQLAISEQNGRIAAMKSATETAEAARLLAEQKAVALAKASASRVARIDAISLTSCDDAIRDVWGIKQ